MSVDRVRDGEVVEHYYGRAADHYAATWDPGGRMHWGYFEDAPADVAVSLGEAIEAWDRRLCHQAGITGESVVLDVGCGTGATTSWLAATTGCAAVGVDVQLDRGHRRSAIPLVRGDAMRLPFGDDLFSHVWCQAMLCHVPDRSTVLAEVCRVLAPGGILALDDVITPSSEVSPVGRAYYYDRVANMGPQLTHGAYLALLTACGLTVLDTQDLSAHMRRSYEHACERIAATHPDAADTYRGVIRTIDLRDLGWAAFICQRP
ncbi:methyltransferase domain-containing protein [Nocardia sp. NBC_00881]|uniref:methyltransferase domain-containing protein n=1 Tax=Nocardia sp. NBC_00881 TaxID=2975995 RepID=UPI0038707314|nr:methyltransferase domain-containing protein [Nocardia sp. NBC_00881]